MKTKINTTDAIFPMPVLMIATYNDDGSVNVMNAAWGTMVNGDIVALNLSETHKTVQNIKKRGGFTVSIADAAHVIEADYFGMASGKAVCDKLSVAGMTAERSALVDAPIVNEFPVCLECAFIEFQSGTYGLGVIGKVVNVSAEEKVLKDSRVDITALDAIAYDPFTHGYYRVSQRVGNAFNDGKKLM